MIDLCPRFVLKHFPNANQKYFCYVFTAIGIALAAYFYNSFVWQESSLLSSGYSLFGTIRKFTHFGIRCPLCGGTRSFLSLFSGNVLQALHYNIFGTMLFLLIYVLLPFRMAIAFGLKDYPQIKIWDGWFEKYFLHLLSITYILQASLNYLGFWLWTA